MSTPRFSFTQDALKTLAAEVLQQARALGASDAACEFSEGHALSVTVRQGSVETIEHNRDKGMGVTVYIGQRRGHASSSDFSSRALHDAVKAAYDIARFTAEDDCAGLPDAEQLETAPPDLDLYHPWALDADHAAQLAQRAEAAALATSPLIRNSEGASVSANHGQFVMANTRGFSGGYPYSRHYLSCAPIAGQGKHMQRDDWYSSARDHRHMATPEAVGRYAAERALARLHARSLKTRQVPVLFDAPLAVGLLGSFTQAVSGGALYRKSSFLLDSLGQAVMAEHLTLKEDPTLRAALGSTPFDEEGVKVAPRDVVHDGVLQGYFLSCYSARKLGMQTTGNAGGSHNLFLTSRHTQAQDNLPAMLRKLGTGLFVTELMGQGVNTVTGDYSRGAFGYWVEGGEICYPVQEITIAGNLKQMLHDITAIGSDVITRGTKNTGSILLSNMTVAGA